VPARDSPEYEALYERTFREPTNLDAAFRFAEVAAAVGDYEAAIGALERMLFYNPNLPRVKLELGVLYFKLGSYQMAGVYFEQAVKTPGAPADVKAKVNQFLAEIARRLSPHKWSVFAQTGWRYQTNASAGPDGLAVKALGQDAVLNSQFAKAPDWNWFGVTGITYAYDLQNGHKDALEASIVGYYAKQVRLPQFDLGLVEVQAGPRFGSRIPHLEDLTFKIYGIGTATSLASNTYFYGPGAGVSARYEIANRGRFEPSLEYRHRQFENSVDYPTAYQQTGSLVTAAVAFDHVITENVGVATRVAYDVNTTDEFAFAFNSYKRWSADVGIPIQFTVNLPNSTHQMVVIPNGGVSYARYRIPNPVIDPDVARRDHEWHIGSVVEGQIYQNLGLRTQILYSRTNSNLPNYDTKNFSVAFGPTVRF
jgi:tetratricopeptide (TPR) repeat protein